MPWGGRLGPAPPARPFKRRRGDEPPRRRRDAVGHAIDGWIRVLKDAAGARRLERLRPLPVRERLARDRAKRRRFSPPHEKIGGQHHFPRALQPAAVVPEFHVGSRYANLLPGGAARGDDFDARYELADQTSLEMRVPVDRAADGSGGAGPRFEAGDAAVDRPAHQAVDREP